jgi:hypothetical protein
MSRYSPVQHEPRTPREAIVFLDRVFCHLLQKDVYETLEAQDIALNCIGEIYRMLEDYAA